MFDYYLTRLLISISVTYMNTYQITPNPSLPATAMANVWAGYTVRLVRRIGFGNVQVALNNGQTITVHNSNLRNI